MAEAKKEVRLVILAKFKEDATPEKIEEAITEYAKLVDVIPAMNSFHWYIISFLYYINVFLF